MVDARLILCMQILSMLVLCVHTLDEIGDAKKGIEPIWNYLANGIGRPDLWPSFFASYVFFQLAATWLRIMHPEYVVWHLVFDITVTHTLLAATWGKPNPGIKTRWLLICEFFAWCLMVAWSLAMR